MLIETDSDHLANLLIFLPIPNVTLIATLMVIMSIDD